MHFSSSSIDFLAFCCKVSPVSTSLLLGSLPSGRYSNAHAESDVIESKIMDLSQLSTEDDATLHDHKLAAPTTICGKRVFTSARRVCFFHSQSIRSLLFAHSSTSEWRWHSNPTILPMWRRNSSRISHSRVATTQQLWEIIFQSMAATTAVE